jgi:hypothetical protein
VLGLRHIFSAPAFGLFGTEKTSHSGKRYAKEFKINFSREKLCDTFFISKYQRRMNNSQSRKKMELKSEIEKLVENFKNEKAWNRSEEHIQSLFTIKLLSLLGYDSSNIRINQGQEVKTGKKPDILLFNNSGNTLLVIESKDAAKQDTLDGKYKDKTFIEQLNGYCHAEGIHWGVLTNFVEWRIYSIYQIDYIKRRNMHFMIYYGKMLIKKIIST